MSDHAPLPEDKPTVGQLVERLSEQITRLIRAELALARAEAAKAIAKLAVGLGLMLFAAVIVPYLVAVLIVFGIAYFDTGGSLWAAAGWVALIMLGLMVVLGGAGYLVLQLSQGKKPLQKSTQNVTEDISTIKEGLRP